MLLPTIRHDDTLDFTYAHCGVSAKRFAWIRDENEPIQNARYRYAMKVEQDAFQKAVSQHFDHARSGPRRKRTPRLESLRRQQLDLEMAAIEAAKADLQQREAAFRREVDRVEATLANATLAGALSRLSQAQADLSALKRLCADQEAELAFLRAHLGTSDTPK